MICKKAKEAKNLYTEIKKPYDIGISNLSYSFSEGGQRAGEAQRKERRRVRQEKRRHL